MECPDDRTAEDLGKHSGSGTCVNITVPDQEVATTFYVSGLGSTRDRLPDDWYRQYVD